MSLGSCPGGGEDGCKSRVEGGGNGTYLEGVCAGWCAVVIGQFRSRGEWEVGQSSPAIHPACLHHRPTLRHKVPTTLTAHASTSLTHAHTHAHITRIGGTLSGIYQEYAREDLLQRPTECFDTEFE